MKEVKAVKITTIVDNEVWMRGLLSTWGLSFYISFLSNNKRHSILMDTSGSFQTFYHNALRLGLDLALIEAVFISHWHSDHYGALSQVLSLLKPQTPVYVPSENSFGVKEIRNAGGTPIICNKPTRIFEGVMSTGRVPNRLSEHSLMVNVKNKGLIVLTGCSHPGIINTLTYAQKVSGIRKIYAVIGGFHISGLKEGLRVGRFLQRLDVKLVSPCHCTSKDAKRGIARIMGERYAENGSGKTMFVSHT